MRSERSAGGLLEVSGGLCAYSHDTVTSPCMHVAQCQVHLKQASENVQSSLSSIRSINPSSVEILVSHHGKSNAASWRVYIPEVGCSSFEPFQVPFFTLPYILGSL